MLIAMIYFVGALYVALPRPYGKHIHPPVNPFSRVAHVPPRLRYAIVGAGLIAVCLIVKTEYICAIALITLASVVKYRRIRGNITLSRELNKFHDICNSCADLLNSGYILLPALKKALHETDDYALYPYMLCVVQRLELGQSAPQEVTADDRAASSSVHAYLQTLSNNMYNSLRCGLEYGLPMSEILYGLAKHTKFLVSLRDKVRASCTGAQWSAITLLFLPVLGWLLGYAVGANPCKVLFNSPSYSIIMLLGVLFLCAGSLWSDRILAKAVEI